MAPFYQHQQQLDIQRKDKLHDYLNAKDVYDNQRSSTISSNKTNSSDDIKHALQCLGDEPDPPIGAIKIISDLTIEGLTKYLIGGQPSIAVIATEGGQILGGHGFSKEHILSTAAGLSKIA